MKFVVSLIAIAFVASASCADVDTVTFNRLWMMDFGRKPPVPMQQSDRDLEIKLMEMQVDNFDPQNVATFEMVFI